VVSQSVTCDAAGLFQLETLSEQLLLVAVRDPVVPALLQFVAPADDADSVATTASFVAGADDVDVVVAMSQYLLPMIGIWVRSNANSIVRPKNTNIQLSSSRQLSALHRDL